jgi:succinyl-diaminopimelate desuccinylase
MKIANNLKIELFKEIEHLETEMVESLCHILQFPAVSPHNGGLGEEAKAQELSKLIGELGVSEGAKFEWIRIPDDKSQTGNRPSIVLRVPGKTQQRLWILSHLDVVSEGDIRQWDTEPFEAVVKDGKIYARGANDNGQILIASLYALRALKNLDLTPEYEICLAFLADEEMGSRFGLVPIINQGIVDFRKDDMILVPDQGNSTGDFIEIAEKGLLQMEFTITGKQIHASTPDLGLNACRVANIFSVELDDALHKAFPDRDKLFSPETSTFEPTRRYTNVVSVNVIPGTERLSFDCRVLPHIKLDDVIEVAEKVIKSIMSRIGVKIGLKTINRHDPAQITSKESLVAKLLVNAIKEVFNVEPRFGGIGGGTFAVFLRHEGIPSIVWAQYSDDQSHQHNEYALIEHMLNNAKVFALMMLGV